jgi:hypothetical protein
VGSIIVPAARFTAVFVTLGFLVLISSAGLFQTAVELRDGDRPGALEIFDHAPTARNLHTFERNLEESSVVAGRLRPWMQYAAFSLLAKAGEKVVVGRDGWLFYRESLRYATERAETTKVAEGSKADPLPAIKSFHDQLASRGIRLLVVPVPNKESIYPEILSGRAQHQGVVVCRPTRLFMERLQEANIAAVDLFEAFREAKAAASASNPVRFYLQHDTHWTPEGMQIAVNAVARFIRERGWIETGTVDYDVRPIRGDRLEDLLRMLHVPRLERAIGPAHLVCEQIVQRDTGRPYHDEPAARILVLGDSFLRIYEQDEPGTAGFIAHLARALAQPLTTIVSDGGASTLVRQELIRRPRSLMNKTLVIWEFVERDIGGGTEGWQVLPLSRANSERR